MRPRLLLLLALGACWPGSERVADGQAAGEQIRHIMSRFAVANEFHHEDEGTYTDDLKRLQEGSEWSNADSVRLQVTLAPGGTGWAVVGTHKRVGASLGCALAWGEPVPVETPGGVPHDGSNRIVCDEQLATRGNQDAP